MNLIKEKISSCGKYKVEICKHAKGNLFSIIIYELYEEKDSWLEIKAATSLARSLERAEKLAEEKMILFTKGIQALQGEK